MILLLLACARAPSAPTAVLVVTVDTWRADHLTPSLAPEAWALASRGQRFPVAWSPIGLTTPAHATLFTGRQPWTHGVRANNHHGYLLPEAERTLAEQASDAGWATAAFVSAWPAGPDGGLHQGFDASDAPDAGERPGQVAVDNFRLWHARQEGPWFAWVHLYEPHGPYEGPAHFDDVQRYALEVGRADALLGQLLSAIDGRTLVVVTADHGEVHREEPCGWQHERSLHDAVFHVPLLLAGPGVARGVRADAAWLADLAPTVLDLAGLPPLPDTDGRSLRVAAPPRPRVVEAGLCDPDCLHGCDPPGPVGKPHRADPGAEGSWVPPGAPPGQVQEERARVLGYVE